jgi:hypothetical protein
MDQHIDKAQKERHDRLIEQMRRILGSEICAIFDIQRPSKSCSTTTGGYW